jgi:arylformamidase
MRGWIDITTALGPATRVFPGDLPVRLTVEQDPARGDASRVTSLRMSVHAGTHVDAPNHLHGGKGGVEKISPDSLIGPAIVVKLHRREGGMIRAADLTRIPRRAPARILFKGSPIILPEAAEEMVRRGIRLVGTDGLSIDPVDDRDLPAHHLLLRAGIVVLEGLDLSRAPAGRYRLIALPLLIPGADGSPARALLHPRKN